MQLEGNTMKQEVEQEVEDFLHVQTMLKESWGLLTATPELNNQAAILVLANRIRLLAEMMDR
jgi:hypothetical protein